MREIGDKGADVDSVRQVLDKTESAIDIEGDFVPGAYEIVPVSIRRNGEPGGVYQGMFFSRHRHHRQVPDRIVSGLTAPEAIDLPATA